MCAFVCACILPIFFSYNEYVCIYSAVYTDLYLDLSLNFICKDLSFNLGSHLQEPKIQTWTCLLGGCCISREGEHGMTAAWMQK